jgi:tRNA-splicing ligase RtcB (3'-phosphate/5'-hydroxy nucleic acid ligase)
VDEIFEPDVAQVFGLTQGHLVAMIHCGSRGLGHQVCTDYVRIMMKQLPSYGYTLPDRELVCAPVTSKEGQDYYSAMSAAANFAWANRHTIAHWVRQAWESVIGSQELKTIYDVSHNIGKREVHSINGVPMDLMVHRKGATRAFGPGNLHIPKDYQGVGQPVFIPGTMGTSSYVLAGTHQGMEQAFGSSCHGAGRRLSRSKAKKVVSGQVLKEQLEAKGIIIKCDSVAGLAEEAPIAYKDVDNVVDVVVGAGLARKIAKLKPIAVIKGG